MEHRLKLLLRRLYGLLRDRVEEKTTVSVDRLCECQVPDSVVDHGL
jgi:hypothetical protein